MNIGLDYDDTYTRDPDAWDAFILFMSKRGHKVYIVTWRDDAEGKLMHFNNADALDVLEDVYCTNRQAKQKFMFDQGVCIDVWIDDNPFSITKSMELLDSGIYI